MIGSWRFGRKSFRFGFRLAVGGRGGIHCEGREEVRADVSDAVFDRGLRRRCTVEQEREARHHGRVGDFLL